MILAATTLISFDIDGTLECGSPPGVIDRDALLAVRDGGCVVGSASDRPVATQVALWAALGITPAFTVLKQHLDTVRLDHPAQAYWHIGDSDVDRYFARHAAFSFLEPCEFVDAMRAHGLAKATACDEMLANVASTSYD